jgi:hypothetical protein
MIPHNTYPPVRKSGIKVVLRRSEVVVNPVTPRHEPGGRGATVSMTNARAQRKLCYSPLSYITNPYWRGAPAIAHGRGLVLTR